MPDLVRLGRAKNADLQAGLWLTAPIRERVLLCFVESVLDQRMWAPYMLDDPILPGVDELAADRFAQNRHPIMLRPASHP
ncbi:hypothetical protein ACW9YV_29720 (plasmid) [Paraburkholderia strydomiana]